MAILCNFTPDKVVWEHIGHRGSIKPGEIKEFKDGRANHILNQLKRKGIMRYQLNGDEDAMRAQAMRTYKQFWINQITTFNQQNEAARNENRPYNHPTEELRGKADEFGVELIAPFKMQPQSESSKVSELKAENEGLKTELGEMKTQMTELMDLVKSNMKEKKVYVDFNDLIQKFNSLGKDRFMKWVIVNSEEIETWPEPVIEKAKEKWNSFYPDKEWPLSDEE